MATPTFLSLNFFVEVAFLDAITLRGTNFDADVTIRVGGITALNIVRVSAAEVTFQVPSGVAIGPVDLDIENVAGGEILNVPRALTFEGTRWTPNGGSTRIATFGDFIISGTIRIGDPLPFGDPNIDITDWTTVSRSPS